MAVTDYLSELIRQRDILKQILSDRELDVEECSTYNQLIRKVAELTGTQKTGAQNGVWTPTLTSESFVLTCIPFIPAKLSMCCEDILTKSYTSVDEDINIAILNVELNRREIEVIKNRSEGIVSVEADGIYADMAVTENAGFYTVAVSFSNANQSLQNKYKFKANASYVWLIAEEGWLI